MEGVVRVSSANMNDRRNRWETGNGGGGRDGWGERGERKKRARARAVGLTKTTENERIPLPSLFLAS